MRRCTTVCILLGMLLGCGHRGNHPSMTSAPSAALLEQVELYKSLAPRGWDVSGTCDALLFVSLQHVGLDEAGPIEQAQGEPGRWFRLPSPLGASCSSDISRDMFMGLFSYIWHFHRLDLAEDIWSYGVAHKWVMGQERSGTPNDRVVLTPNLISLLASIINGLGGTDHPERLIPATYETSPGYVSHLTLLQIALLGDIHHGLSDREIAALQAITKHMAGNPLVHALLHKYTDGDQTVATNLLLSIWPADRLPTGRDWDDQWRTQRSDGDAGLLPGDNDTVHSGGDFLFAAGIVLGTI